MIFDGVVLLSDIDGTLSTYERKISPKNIEAIEYFIKNGGKFGIATGRTGHSASKIVGRVPVNCPCLVVNGGVIYDYIQNKPLYSCCLDHNVTGFFHKIIEKVPNIGIEINNNGVLQCVKYSPRSYDHIMYEFGEFTQFTLRDIPEDSRWLKVLFTGEPNEIDQLLELCNELIAPDAPCYVVRSERIYLELLPKEANKGKGLVRLANMLQVPINNVYAIGDYYNDLDLLTAAGCSATVQGAPKELLAVTDYVTCSCEDGAVADFISYIEQKIKNNY